MLRTPVALCIFNRPDVTQRVLEAIARAQPTQLFVFADGPRSAEEASLCQKTRALVEAIDWDCDVRLAFSAKNLGIRSRIPSGLDWVFSHVDRAIFLEDDCLPDPSFFQFCDAMLEEYLEHDRVMMVSGTNYLQEWKAESQSYHFSHFGSPWGWATWRRAWRFYEDPIAAWSKRATKKRIRKLLDDDHAFAIQARRFDHANRDLGYSSPWDVQWMLTRLLRGGLSVVPARNLVRNLGNHDGRGIPTEHPIAKLEASAITFPLSPPERVDVDRCYDRFHVRRQYGDHA